MEKIKQFVPLAQIIIAVFAIGYVIFSVLRFVYSVAEYQREEIVWRGEASKIINQLIQKNGQ